ncbi:MAG: ABC-F family ATP-binding cassette domain-containing protein [bacterium]
MTKMLVNVDRVSKSFGSQDVLRDVSLQIYRGDKIGLVGLNGSGKTTLLRLIAGEELPSSGEIVRTKGVTIGYLSQISNMSDSNTLYDEMLEVFADLARKWKELKDLEFRMGGSEGEELGRILERYNRLSLEYERDGGFSYESLVRQVLSGLGFPQDHFEKPVCSLSGGEKTRVALAKLLLQEPDLMLLDEPTNHLDLDSTEWLEDFLAKSKRAMVLVSHDKYFLNRIVNRVAEIWMDGTLSVYKGSYSQYGEQKAERLSRWRKEYELQQEEIARQEEFIRRNIAGQNTGMAQSRRNLLERMKRIPPPPRDPKRAYIRFAAPERSGDLVLKAENISKAYPTGNGGGERVVLDNVSLTIYRGEKVGLIGPNGSGKTTLLNAIVHGDSGDVRFGVKVKVGYYAQEQETLNESNTVLEEVWEMIPDAMEGQVRSLLGSFLFSGEDVLKPISALSGGERARVALVKLFLSKANFLIMDEPTNHLDMISIEVLESALKNFEGALLFVSHDRSFLDSLATRILELKDGRLTEYAGNYSYYRERKLIEAGMRTETASRNARSTDREERARRRSKPRSAGANRKNASERKIDPEKVEEEIIKLEERERELFELLASPALYRDGDRAREVSEEYRRVRERIDSLYELWGAE